MGIIALVGIVAALQLFSGGIKRDAASLISAVVEHLAFSVNKTNIPAEDVGSTRSPITLLFVGDIMLARGIGEAMRKRDDWKYPFAYLAADMRGADITMANLESPISDKGRNGGSIYAFRADPRAMAGLTDAGIDMLTIANNHIWDYGALAFRDTLMRLRQAGIRPIGGGESYAVAHESALQIVRGMRVAFLGYTTLLPRAATATSSQPTTAAPDGDQMRRDIVKAKQRADAVVVTFHWGAEYQTHHNAEQKRLAHAAIDAGALLVIGHHPHVVQDTELYENGFIAYSLGNFIFDQNFSPETEHGLMLRITVQPDGTRGTVERIPLMFTKAFQPVRAIEEMR